MTNDKFTDEELAQIKSSEITYKLDEQIRTAIYRTYGKKLARKLENHFDNTIDDAASYFGNYGEERDETMYSGDFEYRLRDIEQ